MLTEMDFWLLGPLTVRRGGDPMPVPPGNQRVILAALLLKAGQVVRVDELAESVWGQDVPSSGPVVVQNCVMRLRKALGDTDRDRIVTEPPGYLIRVAADELDLSRFEAVLRAARTAARDCRWDQAATRAGEALDLWRGEPLADVRSEVLALRAVPRLAELRLQAVETFIEARMNQGRHCDVIAELRQLTGAHPLRERLHAQLMLALYRDGRQAEALAAYQRARQVLISELGSEPGTGLRELHQRMLGADPALAAPLPSATTANGTANGAANGGVPRQLPAGIRPFVGRTAELRALTGLLDRSAADTPGTVVISVIGGTAGVGKTALALRWAHQVAERFPDGQLYVNLRGYDPGRPMAAADALGGFLRALGVPGQDIAADEGERAARYRSQLAGKRMLVVLDNASRAEQVRPLLPGSPACAVVITSRDSLASLVARDGAERLDLGLLSSRDAVGLLRELIGGRVDTDPGAAAALAGKCARLPLALRIAAEQAGARPAAPLADLASELTDQKRRLDLLETGGDPRTAMRAVFSWSYRHLDPGAARMFRLAGLHPGPDLDAHAAAALAGQGEPPEGEPLDQAGHLLDALARAYLIQATGPGRYGMHDLLRAYARELAAARDGPQARREALTRLFDHYLHTAAAVMDMAYPAEHDGRPRISPPTSPGTAVTGIAAARAWLDAERATLAAVVAHAATRGWPGHATRLASTLFRYLETGAYHPEIIAISDHARDAARETGDRAAEAEAEQDLVVTDLRQGRYQQAVGRLQRSLTVCRQVGNQVGEARALGNLGITSLLQGRYQQADSYLKQALAAYRQTGDQGGEARQLGNLGLVELRLGRYREASQHLDQALTLCRQTGNQTAAAYALSNLGVVQSRLGDHQRASEHLGQALTLCRQTGDRSSEAETLNSLGEILLAAGRADEAKVQQATALGLASRIGNSYEQARARDGLGRACHAAGDPAAAVDHWREAMTRYTELGVPEADAVRARLTAVARWHVS